jgi:hypothetical protein
MVSFRISAEEYEMYRSACLVVGCRNLSELARASIERTVGAEKARVPVSDQLRDLREIMQALSIEVLRISQKLDGENTTARTGRAMESTV